MYSEKDFIIQNYTAIEEGIFSWSAPSNIALVKYWGKKAYQIPENPSISFTLDKSKTTTLLKVVKKSSTTALSFELFFEGKPKDSFRPKVQKFLERIDTYCPYLKEYHLEVHTENTFPHSSGIASSASSMAALAATIMSLEKAISTDVTTEYFNRKASFLARLGSGSACRSIQGETVVWGNHVKIAESSNLYGVPFAGLHKKFANCQDTILLVDKGEKQVSSTVGHNLMHNHPFAKQRFQQAHKNLSTIIKALHDGDWGTFIAIVESEALTLHAMMMTSMPYYILMKPNTLEIINKIWDFRTKTQLPVCFTLDAGANLHLLYPEAYKQEIMQFVQDELVVYCQNGQYINDNLGKGAKQLK